MFFLLEIPLGPDCTFIAKCSAKLGLNQICSCRFGVRADFSALTKWQLFINISYPYLVKERIQFVN